MHEYDQNNKKNVNNQRRAATLDGAPRPVHYSYGILLYSETATGAPEQRVYLAARRAHSIGFLEVRAGHYDLGDWALLQKLCDDMTVTERALLIRAASFADIWTHASPEGTQFEEAKRKYELLRHGTGMTWARFCARCPVSYEAPCIEFPKGRKQQNAPTAVAAATAVAVPPIETAATTALTAQQPQQPPRAETNLECAQRELKEETGIGPEVYDVQTSCRPIYETFIGLNGKRYIYAYFLAQLRPTVDRATLLLQPQTEEVSDVGWHTYRELMLLIRAKDEGRKRMLTKAHHLVNSQNVSDWRKPRCSNEDENDVSSLREPGDDAMTRTAWGNWRWRPPRRDAALCIPGQDSASEEQEKDRPSLSAAVNSREHDEQRGVWPSWRTQQEYHRRWFWRSRPT